MGYKVTNEIDVEALSHGSVKNFDLLYMSYYPKAKTFLMNMLDDADEAEDLAQDAFVKLWTSREQLAQVRNLNSYVYQTVKYTLFAHVNKKKEIMQTGIEGAYDLPSQDDLESVVCSNELEQLIEHVIDSMPPQRKRIFTMSRKEGMTTEEISQKLGISKRTVETHISLALATLRNAILSFIFFFLC